MNADTVAATVVSFNVTPSSACLPNHGTSPAISSAVLSFARSRLLCRSPSRGMRRVARS